MKKLLLLLMLCGAGYWYYENVYSLPIHGVWAPDQNELMGRAYKSARMTPDQAAQLKTYIASTRVVIARQSIEFQMPGLEGTFDYSVSRSGDHCFLVDVAKVGHFDACVEGNTLTMRNTKTGYLETYHRS